MFTSTEPQEWALLRRSMVRVSMARDKVSVSLSILKQILRD